MAAEEELSHVLDDEEDEEDCRKDVQRGDRKNPIAGEAMYDLGICRMHGTGCEQKPASAIACLRLAESLGNEKAGEELSFWKEAQQFLEEAQDHEADESMRRKEAMYRLQMLTHMGLSETALEAFSKNGTICFAYDDDCGVSFPDPEEERTREIQDEIKTLEHMHNATAYLVQMTAPLWVTHVSVCYVSACTDEWKFDRKQILDLSPYVYAFDMQYDSKDYCADIGPIGISVHQGGMERTW